MYSELDCHKGRLLRGPVGDQSVQDEEDVSFEKAQDQRHGKGEGRMVWSILVVVSV